MAMKATVHIRAAVRNGATRLVESYATPPFKVADITEDRGALLLHLMLMSSSPGILDGDAYAMRIDLEERSQLHLHTQAYQRLFQMTGGARQSMEIHLQEGAALCYVPHPTVPHRSSVYTGINRIYLAEDCRLIWGEVLTCGRKLNGEIFAFSKYHSMTEIFKDGHLLLRENIFLQPSTMQLRGIGQMEGYTHQASLLVIGRDWTGTSVEDRIREYTHGHKDILVGLSAGPAGSRVLRLLGHQAGQLHGILQAIAVHLFSGTPLSRDSNPSFKDSTTLIPRQQPFIQDGTTPIP